MGSETAISWTNRTWNPVQGCKKVSLGCRNCYMYRDKTKYGQDPEKVIRSSDKTFYSPLHWPKEPAMVFTCSWSDWFIEDADPWRDEMWDVIKKTPHLTYQILTKRPDRIREHLPSDWGLGYPNVWLGVSIENQKAADERINWLKSIPAHVRFLSVEPLIGAIVFDELTFYSNRMSIDKNRWNYGADHGSINWVIIGGESGNDHGLYRYRPCILEWIQPIIEQCNEHKVPVFMKQLGTYLSKEMDLKSRHGTEWDEWPEHLKIRQFPK